MCRKSQENIEMKNLNDLDCLKHDKNSSMDKDQWQSTAGPNESSGEGVALYVDDFSADGKANLMTLPLWRRLWRLWYRTLLCRASSRKITGRRIIGIIITLLVIFTLYMVTPSSHSSLIR